jgi:hypothetical protein
MDRGPQKNPDEVQIPQEDQDEAQYHLTGPKLWAILFAVGLIMFTVMLDVSIVATVRRLILVEI